MHSIGQFRNTIPSHCGLDADTPCNIINECRAIAHSKSQEDDFQRCMSPEGLYEHQVKTIHLEPSYAGLCFTTVARTPWVPPITVVLAEQLDCEHAHIQASRRFGEIRRLIFRLIIRPRLTIPSQQKYGYEFGLVHELDLNL